jgi:hypothetical protein
MFAMDAAANGTHTLATGDIYRPPIMLARKSVCNRGVCLPGSGGDGPRNDDDPPPEYQIVMHAPLTACILHVLGRPAFGSRSEEKEKVRLAKARGVSRDRMERAFHALERGCVALRRACAIHREGCLDLMTWEIQYCCRLLLGSHIGGVAIYSVALVGYPRVQTRVFAGGGCTTRRSPLICCVRPCACACAMCGAKSTAVAVVYG